MAISIKSKIAPHGSYFELGGGLFWLHRTWQSDQYISHENDFFPSCTFDTYKSIIRFANPSIQSLLKKPTSNQNAFIKTLPFRGLQFSLHNQTCFKTLHYIKSWRKEGFWHQMLRLQEFFPNPNQNKKCVKKQVLKILNIP